jgi:2-polyprenyl-3-methyl-5-hydroxy-6-metoxy-1,4-benzoquinol methylase
MDRFYPIGYEPHRRASLERKAFRSWYPFRRFTGRPCPERRSLPWYGEGRLLDFGCGGGEFLCRMRDQGWKVTGMDASLEVVRELRERLGLRAYAGTLPHPKLHPNTFDVVCMWSSLEHVHQPLEALRAAYRLLTPGGRLYLTVPNFESWPYRWFRHNWFGLELPRHLTHFTASTLRTMVEVAGFRIQMMRMVAHPEWLRRSARTAIRAGQGNWLSHLLKRKAIAKLATWLCYVAGRSDCIMALAERPA